MNEFTGERVIPGQVEIDLWNEHFARYAFAARFATGRRVLDAGCGSGYGAAELNLTARSVTGLDVSIDALQHARQYFPPKNIRLTAASASALPFESGSFDLVTAFEVIEHLRDWRAFIAEAHRVLSHDGLFLVSTPNKQYYTESRGPEGSNPYHVYEFEAQEFEDALSAVFPNVELMLQNRSEAFVFYPNKRFFEPVARIDSSAGSADSAHFFVALCSKQPFAPLQSFVYVPRASNLLREREQHILKLQDELALTNGWLEETRAERAQVMQAFEHQKAHLEEQNGWALGLERDWKAAQQRIVDLQNESIADAERYGRALAELEDENRAKTEWALETERRLSVEIEQFRTQLVETVHLLEAAEATMEERTRWALDLKSKLDRAEAQIAAAKASRWVRVGRMFGAGPQL